METFLTSEALGKEKARKLKSFRVYLKIKLFVLQNYWLDFIHRGINRHLSTLNCFDCQLMYLVPCGWNLKAQTGRKFENWSGSSNSGFLKAAAIGIFPSSFHSTLSFLYKLIHYPYLLFSSFLPTIVRPNLPECRISIMLLCNKIFFPQLPATLSIAKYYYLNNFEKENFEFYCSQRKLDWLRIPKLAYACDSSWDSNSFVSKTTEWTPSIKVLMENFICV